MITLKQQKELQCRLAQLRKTFDVHVKLDDDAVLEGERVATDFLAYELCHVIRKGLCEDKAIGDKLEGQLTEAKNKVDRWMAKQKKEGFYDDLSAVKKLVHDTGELIDAVSVNLSDFLKRSQLEFPGAEAAGSFLGLELGLKNLTNIRKGFETYLANVSPAKDLVASTLFSARA